MDKVVQQNAANAEESASGSEEMSAQAEQLKDYVQHLVIMIKGTAKEKSSHSDPVHNGTTMVTSLIPETSNTKHIPVKKIDGITPDQVIPFDDRF